MAALAAGAGLGAMRADVVPLGEMSRSYDPVLLCDRMQCGVEEADDMGFPGLGRGGQALGVPGVRHDPHLHAGRCSGLDHRAASGS